MQSIDAREVARQFVEASDEQAEMHDIHVAYLGSVPAELAFKISSPRDSKIVGVGGNIVPINTVELIGGVIYKLAEQGELDANEWTPLQVLGVCIEIGSILGRRQAREEVLRSASRAVAMTAEGPVIPTAWLAGEQSK